MTTSTTSSGATPLGYRSITTPLEVGYGAPIAAEVIELSELSWAAATVGWALEKDTALSGPPALMRRSAHQLAWRMLVPTMALEQGKRYWQRPDDYKGLDPSEKGAVSYFLGMIQASVRLSKLKDFQIHHLVHLDLLPDSLRKGIGRHTRPDFLGFSGDPAGNWQDYVIEVKGRSSDADEGPKLQAWTQAAAFWKNPNVPYLANSIPVASIASFEEDLSQWTSHIRTIPNKNWPAPRPPSVEIRAAIGSYYQRLSSLVASTGSPSGSHSEAAAILADEFGVRFDLPDSIKDSIPTQQTNDVSELAVIGEVYIRESAIRAVSASRETDETRPTGSFEASGPWRSGRQDGTSVVTGPDWFTVSIDEGSPILSDSER